MPALVRAECAASDKNRVFERNGDGRGGTEAVPPEKRWLQTGSARVAGLIFYRILIKNY